MASQEHRDQLIRLIRKLSYREGDFTLASGKRSSFYVDVKNVSLHPEGAALIGEIAWELLDPSVFGGVGGPTLGADPLATGLSLAAYRRDKVVPAFIIRKEPKKHGTSQWIEGRENLATGANLLIVEDVVTTGGSSLQAIERVRSEGFVVKKLLCVIDRREGGQEALMKAGVELVALTRIDEIRNVR